MRVDEHISMKSRSEEPPQPLPEQQHQDVLLQRRKVNKAKGSFRQHALQQRNELNLLMKRTDKLLISELREMEIQSLQQKVQKGRQDGRIRSAHKQARATTPSAYARPSSAMAIPRTPPPPPPPQKILDLGMSMMTSSIDDSGTGLENSTSRLQLHIHLSHEELPNAVHKVTAPPLKYGYPPRANRPRSPEDRRSKEEIIRNILPNIAKTRPKSASVVLAKTAGLQLTSIEDNNSISTTEALEYELLMKEHKNYKWDLKDLPNGVYAAEASPPKVRKYVKVSDLKPRPKSAVDYRHLHSPSRSMHADKKNHDDDLTPRSASTHGDVYPHGQSRDQDGMPYFPRRSMNNSRESSVVVIPSSSYRFNNGAYDNKASRDMYHHTLNQTSIDSNLILFSPQRLPHQKDRDTLWD